MVLGSIMKCHYSRNKIQKMINKIYIPDKTWIDLEQEPKFQKFMREYIGLLQKRLNRVEVIGNSESYTYFNCGQAHSEKNPGWDPFKYLWQICKKYGYDPYIAKDIIELRIGKTLVCECQLLRNDRTIRRNELRNSFGLDFGGPGNRDLDVR
jgi:hypothetical protein